MAEEGGPLLSRACLEGVGVYRQVHHEGALGLADREEKELATTSHFLHPRHDLREEGEEGALCVRKTGSYQEMAASRSVGEGEVLSGHAVDLKGC